MIQRLQTIWLLLAAICMALAFKFKFAVGQTLENNVPKLKQINASSSVLTLAFAIAFMAISLFVIFKFKDRKLQMKLSWVNALLAIVVGFFLYNATKPLSDVTFAITAVLPVFALGFTISAIRCIWQDEKLIKETNSDRLR